MSQFPRRLSANSRGCSVSCSWEMCPSHQKQSPPGRLSICKALLGDGYKEQCSYDHRKPLMDEEVKLLRGCAFLVSTRHAVVVSERASRFHPWHVLINRHS